MFTLVLVATPFRAAVSLSPLPARPLSTRTSPSGAEKTTTLDPPPSTTASLSVTLRTPAAPACCAARSHGDAHKVSVPVIAPFITSLRSKLSLLQLRNHAVAVGILLLRNAELVQQ